MSLNLVAADASGAVGQFAVGGVPLRDPMARLPVCGWRDEARWTGVCGLSTLVDRRNPQSGVVVSANEAHCESAGGYPIHGCADHPYRANRIRAALDGGAMLDPAVSRALQRDVSDLAARELLPHVKRALGTLDAAAQPALARVRQLIETWEGDALADSAAAAVFYLATFRYLMPELFPETRFGPLARQWRFAWWGLARIVGAASSPWFADQASKDAALVAAFGNAARWLGERFGDDPAAWSWGAIHELAPRHPLSGLETFAAGAPAPWPAPGSPFTVLQHRFGAPEPPFQVVLGPALRMIADLSTDEVQLALPGGQSGNVTSPHFADQLSAWRLGDYLTIRLGSEMTGDTIELVPG
jgi:penicillin amidase